MVFIYLPLYRNYGIPINLLCLGGGKRTCRCRPVLSADPDSLKILVQGYIAGGTRSRSRRGSSSARMQGIPFPARLQVKGYAAIDPEVTTVIILGPPHYVPVQRHRGAFGRHGLKPRSGRVPVDRERIRKLLENPIAFIDDRRSRPEHSIEVTVPFLQVRLSSFKIVPLIVSETDPEKAAEAISPLIDDHTLVIASSDFSHY